MPRNVIATLSPRVHRQSLHFEIPSNVEWIEPTILFLQRHAIVTGIIDEHRAGRLVLVLHEALTNAIVHGNLEISSELKKAGDQSFAKMLAERTSDPRYANRVVHVEVVVEPGAAHWLIMDEGPGFDYARVMGEEEADPEPVLPSDEVVDELDLCDEDIDLDALLPSGRGLLLMKSFMDEVAYDMGGRRVRLTYLRQSADDRRLSERLPFRRPIRVIPIAKSGAIDWESAFDSLAANLSVGGINFIHRSVPLVQTVLVELGDQTGENYLLLPARIRHVRCLDDGIVNIGCAFDTSVPIQRASLEAARAAAAARVEAGESAVGSRLGAHPPTASDAGSAVLTALDPPVSGNGFHPPSGNSVLFEQTTVIDLVGPLLEEVRARRPIAGERRRQPRFRYGGRVELLCPGTRERIPVFVRDLSNGGMALIAPVPIPRETIELFVYHGFGVPIQLRGSVTRCHRLTEGAYEVGIRFVAWL